MTDGKYYFADRPLYTEDAIGLLEEAEDSFDEALSDGDSDKKPWYAVVCGERASLQQCLDKLEQYDDFVSEVYETLDVPGPHVLARVEEDMSMMARERESRLNEVIFTGSDRGDVLERFMDDEAPRPVLADTWIIMNEAESIREQLTDQEYGPSQA